MKKSNAKKFRKPLKSLLRERDILNSQISKIQKQPIEIIDIANERLEASHEFKVLRVDGDPIKDRSWTQLERIFCKTKCEKCPHGDFLYRYSKRKNGTYRIVMEGELSFDYEVLERMKKDALKHPPQRGELVDDE
jgi:hypothetical protein